jgi:hypothetical protein
MPSRRYLQSIRAFFCLLTLLLLAGCPYESSEPLSAPADAKIDGKLLGRWKYEDRESKEAGFLTISRFNDRELLIVVEENGNKVPDMMRGFVTAVEGGNFLNLQEIRGAFGERKWIFVNYEAGECSLTYKVVNDSLAPSDKVLTSRQVLDLISRNLTNKNIYDGPTTLTCVSR